MPKPKTKKSTSAARVEAELTELELRRQIDSVIESDRLKYEANPKGFVSSFRTFDRYTLWACSWNPADRPGLQMRCYESAPTAEDFAQAIRASSIRNAFAEYRCHHIVERRESYRAGRGTVIAWKVHANPSMPF